jgi:flavin reductase (DIM6/NTAB) family NADH-FMN oxidoreductase RutF
VEKRQVEEENEDVEELTAVCAVVQKKKKKKKKKAVVVFTVPVAGWLLHLNFQLTMTNPLRVRLHSTPTLTIGARPLTKTIPAVFAVHTARSRSAPLSINSRRNWCVKRSDGICTRHYTSQHSSKPVPSITPDISEGKNNHASMSCRFASEPLGIVIKTYGIPVNPLIPLCPCRRPIGLGKIAQGSPKCPISRYFRRVTMEIMANCLVRVLGRLIWLISIISRLLVVVVSTSSKHDPSLRRGITVSSFTSISLQPVPLVAFCVKLPSRASTVLHESNGFVVQFLASDQIAHSVAFSSSVPPPTTTASPVATSSSSTPPIQISASSRGKALNYGRDKDIDDLVSEASRQTLIDDSGAKETAVNRSGEAPESVVSMERKEAEPYLDPFEVLGYQTDPESQLPVLLNTVAAIRCRTHQVMAVGDHEMWIGQVEKVLHGGDGILSEANEPLLYHDRSYRKVGKRIF